MLLMAENQDDRVIWVVVELHRPKQRIRSRIILHLGEFGSREEAEAAFLARIATDPRLREHVESWAVHAEDVLKDRKARAKFFRFGASTGGVAEYADEALRRHAREEEQARERARAAFWNSGGSSSAFATLGLPSAASMAEIKAAYRRMAVQMHPDRGGDHMAMVRLNAAYETAVEYAAWRG
ncbi:J domain-containing protein [Paludisphaera mucosa]|uniref:J domain-containing protein n=1 Tax=Paludisphaera mucosa TaxID=3030827 RepID=A0ABT6FJN2_9BACT|nr:J domain-containing protein [Paludisphaera mucosa]MDG3007757.1 J domain-containing protein [Paludisphaera mucosa]